MVTHTPAPPERVRPEPSERRGLSWLLDNSIRLPGGYRIGLDGIIGIIPGVGDAVGGTLSAWILYKAVRKGVPAVILFRMLINILIDMVVGVVPFLGDIFDFFWKANQKNQELLDSYQLKPDDTRRRASLSILIFCFVLLIAGGLVIYSIFLLFSLLMKAFY